MLVHPGCIHFVNYTIVIKFKCALLSYRVIFPCEISCHLLFVTLNSAHTTHKSSNTVSFSLISINKNQNIKPTPTFFIFMLSFLCYLSF
ncbi:hypothetical protein RIF29_24614 [Crotalaria pallida]|uniref:Uncharacterized protein n=1 Tax=Crotalaria pallida TaxID=3830 RepID=A0AAN9EQ93_CROPI